MVSPHSVNNTSDTEREIHLFDYLEVLFRRKMIVILFFLTLVATVVIITYRMTPIYESEVTILIEEKEPWEGRNILTEFTGLRPSKIQSEIEVIKSRTIAEKVARDLHYDIKVFDASDGLDPGLERVFIPDKLLNKTFIVRFLDGERFVVTDNGDRVSIGMNLLGFLLNGPRKDGIIGSGRVGSLFNSETGLSFYIKEANAHEGASFRIKRISFPQAVGQLMANTTVSPIKNTNVVKISTRDSNSRLAADMANSIVKFYREHDIRARSQQASQVISFIEEQIGPVQKSVDESMSALAMYKSRTDVTDLKEGTRVLINNIADLEKEKAELIVKRHQVSSLYDEIQRKASSVQPSALSILRDPVVQDMIGKLLTLEGRKESLLADYTEKHPQVIALTAEINELRRRISSSIMNILDSLDTRIKNLSAEIDQFKIQLKKLPDKEKELADLVRSVEVNSRLHKFLLEKLNEANIMYASTLSQIQVIDRAVPSGKPVKPNKMLNILLATIIGLVGGVGIAFFVDYLDNSIKTPHSVERRLGLPIFGRIPYVPSNKTEFFRTRDLLHSSSTGLITPESGRSITAESFRSLRTNLQFAVMEKKSKVFHLTSPEAAEGKTTIAANLGITLAMMGSRTLIIDMDLRRPKIHHVFGISKEPGITHLITGKATIEDIMKTTAVEHLYLIPAGVVPPNPAELLSQHRLSDFINDIRGEFDYILLDSPPVLPVTDAQLLGRLADTTFIVLELGETKFPSAEYAIKQLVNVDVNVSGVIINKVRSAKGYGYYNYYYYYYGDEPKKNRLFHKKFLQLFNR
jgi:tyrosine-protein kinase Etk/Wzc